MYNHIIKSEQYHIICKFNNNNEPFLIELIQIMFNQLNFNLDQENKLYFTNFKIFQDALINNQILLNRFLDTRYTDSEPKVPILAKKPFSTPPPLFNDSNKSKTQIDEFMSILPKKRHKVNY